MQPFDCPYFRLLYPLIPSNLIFSFPVPSYYLGNQQILRLYPYATNTWHSECRFNQPSSIQLFSHQSKPTQNPPADEEPSTSTSTPQPLMSLTPSPSSRSYLIDKLLSSTSPGSFGGLGLAGPYPGAVSMQPGASFNLAMESACLTFINRSRQYSNKHSNRPRQRSKVSPEEEPAATASDCDDERSPSPDNSSSNGKERRKPKREKFQPYWDGRSSLLWNNSCVCRNN